MAINGQIGKNSTVKSLFFIKIVYFLVSKMLDFRYVSLCWLTVCSVATEIRAGNKLSFSQGFLGNPRAFFRQNRTAKQNLGSHFKSGAS